MNVLYFSLFLSSLLSKYKSARDILILHGYMKTQMLQVIFRFQKSKTDNENVPKPLKSEMY